MKAVRYSGAAPVAALAAIAAFIAWEAAFASLVGLRTHSWTLWTRFFHGQEWALPVRTAYEQWSMPLVRKISGQAWLAALVAGAGVGLGVVEIMKNLRGVRPPSGGSHLATMGDLKRAGLLSGKPGVLGLPRHSGQGPSLFRPEPHLCQRADALRQGRRLCPPERHRVAGLADRSRFEARDLGHGRGCPPCPRAEGVSLLAGLAGITLLEPARSRVAVAGASH